MLRICSINSIYVSRNRRLTMGLLWQNNESMVLCRLLQLSSNYSTLLNPQIVNSYLRTKKPKVKLKAKPYEELLKVLETHKFLLRHKEFININAKDDLDQRISTEFKDPNEYNGIYTVKHAVKGKKSSSKASEPTVKSTLIKSKKKKPTIRQEDMKRSSKNMHALRALKSYVEVNVNADEVEKAQEYLKRQLNYLEKKYKVKHSIEIDLYNILISGWAQKGRVDNIKHLFSQMIENNVEPDLQSYAGYLEGISRSKFLDVSEINLVVNNMKSKGLSHQDILHKCVFKSDQREKVIEALGFADANLCAPLYMEKNENQYACKLLQKLNDKSFGKSGTVPSFCFQSADILTMTEKQLETEERYSLSIKSVETCSTPSDLNVKSRKFLKECEDSWRKKLRSAIKIFKNDEKRHHFQGFHKHESIYPYISMVDTEILVDLLLQEVRLLAETSEYFNPMEKTLCRGLGMKVMIHYFIWLNKKNEVTEKMNFLYQKYLEYFLDQKLVSEFTPREYWEHLKMTHCEGPTIDLTHAVWPHSVLVKIGTELYSILQKNIAFNASKVSRKSSGKFLCQAFYTHYENGHDVKISKHIGTHPLLSKLYQNAKLDYLEFDASLVPMVSPPKPWVKYDSGGLLLIPTPFVRLNDSAVHQMNYYSKVPSKELNPCFDSLNSLSCCPWIINKPMLDIVINVFQNGGNEELDIPLNPNSFPSPAKVNSSMGAKEKGFVWKQNKELKKKRCETTSLWFDCLYKLSIANHFRDKVFWFPHNLDFRGRVYPTPPHFNHLGSDMARSILLFAEGKPLGKRGLDWLKIQLINLTGFKKRDPHAARLKFADEMIPEIFDSADRPFEGNQWWRTSDKPWQTLACCKELASALRHPRPEEYVSHYPIHQDGSCNGLQHYAALGRDHLGAIEVNLHPSDAPQDVYSGVSALVERERLKDADNDVEIAKILEGHVKRKVVKQTVMTFVYGVTKYGAKLQILKQLKDMNDFPERYQHEAATYLMKKIFLSIKEMFTATQKIQDWFTDCAEHITRVSGDTLEWVTPLGLPVIQPYHKETTLRDNKYLLPYGKENCSTYSSVFEPYQLPNIRKQKNGFAPNFVHSLDASHMMLTSLFCQRHGFTFVSVHDCYWTHASTVEIMNKICREQFVALHQEPILNNLSSYFLDKYARVVNEKIQGSKFKEKSAKLKLRDILSTVPQKGTFDLEKVLESEYFFS